MKKLTKEQIDLKETMLNAALRMTAMDPSISMEDARARIQKKTGFPATEENRNKEYERLSWDSYFMSLAFLVAMRSPDSQTQHGCVIVDQNNGIVSTGYNGWLQGAIDESMPNTRPYKYQHVVHSEVNTILRQSIGVYKVAKHMLQACLVTSASSFSLEKVSGKSLLEIGLMFLQTAILNCIA